MDDLQVERLSEPGNYFLPRAISPYAESVDFLYIAIYWGGVALFIGLIGAALYFAIRYRRTAKNQAATTNLDGHFGLEITWTVIPFILVMILFVWGARDFLRANATPEDPIEITVVGQKWNWIFFHSEGFQSPGKLVVPAGRDVKLVMYSKDVLHSFFIPNLRLKRDVIPNRYTTMVFRTDEKGAYRVFCTEYCGDEHSTMLAQINVVSDVDYAAYVAEAASLVDVPPVELGMRLYQSYGCNACHSLNGDTLVGPSWLGLFGSQRQFTDGTQAVADENYLRTSIIEPQAEIVAGFNNVMPSFGYLSETEVNALIAYIKTIQP